MHSNDKYFYRSDGIAKNRESVVVALNSKNEVALVKITTSKNPKYKLIPNYNDNSKYMTEDIYTMDNEGQAITINDSVRISNDTKFIPSRFNNIPISSVEIIKNDLIANERFGKRNKRRIDNLMIKKPRE